MTNEIQDTTFNAEETVFSDEEQDITLDWTENLTAETLLNDYTFEMIFSASDMLEQKKLILYIEDKARKWKKIKDFRSLLNVHRKKRAKERTGNTVNVTNFRDQPFQLYCGDWVCDDSGVSKNEYSAQREEYVVKFASPIPVMPTAILRNLETETEKIQVEFYKNYQWQYLIAERSVTANSRKIIDLADKGLEVTSENSRLLVNYLSDCVKLNSEYLPTYNALSRMGWHENKFMPYSYQSLKFDGERENRYLYESVKQDGDYIKWIDYTAELRKNKVLRLVMAASFASPLIECCSGLPFIFHLWGGTGSGKTVALMVAMSIWGNPKMGKLTRTLNMTANSLMSTAAFLRNIPFAGDELQIIKAKWGADYDSLIMKLCEGIDRGRMTYDRNNEVKAWYNSFLFTGEEPAIKQSSGGGAKNRVIEVECEERIIENGNAVVNFIGANYGNAGVDYIDGIRSETDLHSQYAALVREIMAHCDTTDKQASAAAFILLADKLAVKYVYRKRETPLSIFDIIPYLAGSKEVDVSERAFSFILSHIDVNIARFNSDYNTGELWGKIDEPYCYINKDILSRELSKNNYEFDAVKKKWVDKGYLILNTQGRYVHDTKCNGVKKLYVKLRVND